MDRYECIPWAETPGTWATMIEASDGEWVLYEGAAARIAALEAQLFVDCPSCNGTGKEICNNPDHGFIDALSFHDIGRIGCPVCGHDELHRSKDPCEKCGGTGKMNRVSNLEAQLAAANDEIERLTGELSPLGLPAPYIAREK